MKDKIKNKMKVTHIMIIALGIILITIGAFHNNIWFDEAYSVAISRHSFGEIWKIGGSDVHPVLYYWMLKIVSLISSEIMALRIFSIIPIAILGVLGFTHIRKDFGEKTGLIFSFLVFFLPTMPIYAVEIRMYSWALLFVSVLAIYAYRLTSENTWKNWIIFFLSSLCSIYIHYYGLMAAGLINLFLFIYFIKEKKKDSIIKILVFGVIQILAYIPWIMSLLLQLKQVSKGFWIGFTFPDTLMELLSFQFFGNLRKVLMFILSIAIYAYLIYIYIKEKKKNTDLKPVKFALRNLWSSYTSSYYNDSSFKNINSLL